MAGNLSHCTANLCVDPLAEALLTRLQSYPAARHTVLGGYFALKHYHDYRITHDVDAWWAEESRELDREQVRAALKTVLESPASEALPGMKLDHSVYPDLDRPPLAPADLATIEDQADYLHRVCAQQDTGLATLKS